MAPTNEKSIIIYICYNIQNLKKYMNMFQILHTNFVIIFKVNHCRTLRHILMLVFQLRVTYMNHLNIHLPRYLHSLLNFKFELLQ